MPDEPSDDKPRGDSQIQAALDTAILDRHYAHIQDPAPLGAGIAVVTSFTTLVASFWVSAGGEAAPSQGALAGVAILSGLSWVCAAVGTVTQTFSDGGEPGSVDDRTEAAAGDDPLARYATEAMEAARGRSRFVKRSTVLAMACAFASALIFGIGTARASRPSDVYVPSNGLLAQELRLLCTSQTRQGLLRIHIDRTRTSDGWVRGRCVASATSAPRARRPRFRVVNIPVSAIKLRVD